jgi:hypothetical protein
VNVDSILIAEYAVVEQGGALTVVRTFNQLNATELPARVAILSVSIIIHAHSSEAGTSHNFELVLMSAKQGRVATVVQDNFVLNAEGHPITPGIPIRHILVFNVMQAEFKEDGPYAFELYIDGTYHAAATFFVNLITQG